MSKYAKLIKLAKDNYDNKVVDKLIKAIEELEVIIEQQDNAIMELENAVRYARRDGADELH